MKTYTVTHLSGEFRLETGMTSDEMEIFVKDNWNYGTDYCDAFEHFSTEEKALARFNELKTECHVTEYPSNKVMRVYWIQLVETEIDEDSNDVFMQTMDEYYPAQ